MTAAVNQTETQLSLVEMEDQGSKNKRPASELMEVKVDVQSEDLNSTHSDTRPLIQDRDPKRINKSLKVTNVHCHRDLINIKHTLTENTQQKSHDEVCHFPLEKQRQTSKINKPAAHALHTTPPISIEIDVTCNAELKQKSMCGSSDKLNFLEMIHDDEEESVYR